MDEHGAARALHALFDEEWEWTLAEFPTYATVVGDSRYDDRWPDMSLEAHARRDVHARDMLDRARAIDRATLPESERLNYDLFRRDLELSVEGQRFPDECLPLTQMNGVHQDVADMIQISPRRTARSWRGWLPRSKTGEPALREACWSQTRRPRENSAPTSWNAFGPSVTSSSSSDSSSASASG